MSAEAMVTVIIPTYNRAHLLPVALDSVLDQSFNNIKIIVVDDGSTDSTLSVLAAYSERVSYVACDHSGSPAVARNVGLRSAMGDYVAFLDSDDYWLPNKLALQVAAMEANPALGLVSANAYLQRDNSVLVRDLYLDHAQEFSSQGLAGLIRDNFVITSTALVRRSVLGQVGCFSEHPGLVGCEDYDLWLRIAVQADIALIREPLIVYRYQTPDSLTVSVPAPDYLRRRLLALERVGQLMVLSDRPPIPKAILNDAIRQFRRYLVLADWHAKQRRSSMGGLVRLFREQPVGTLHWALSVAANRLRRKR